MTASLYKALVAALIALGAVACGSDDPPAADVGDTSDTVSDASDATDVSEDVDLRTCNDTFEPVVLAHGFLASGDTWATQLQRFSSNDACEDWFYIFDWNTLDFGADNEALLDAYIDEVLAETGASQVSLVGHSAGGNLGYTYLRDESHAAKVARYVHVGASTRPQPPGPDGDIPMLNIFSPDDEIVSDSGAIDGAQNESLDGADHYAVATSAEAFVKMYPFLTGEAPTTSDIETEDEIILSGRVVSLGENQVPVGATVDVYLIDPVDGARRRNDPVESFEVGEDGQWGPVQATDIASYEFRVTGPTADDVAISYYRERQVRSNRWIYLRTMPARNSVAGAVVSALPFDEEGAVLAVFSSSEGMLADVDSLTVDGVEMLNEATASADANTIAMFFYDDGADEESSLASISDFERFPFLRGVDLYNAGDGRSTTFRFNEREISVIRRPGTEGAVIAVFD